MNTNDLNLNNDIFIENNPQDKFDTKLDYITNSEVNVTFGTQEYHQQDIQMVLVIQFKCQYLHWIMY